MLENLARPGLAIVIIKVANAVMTLIISVAVARILGASEFGRYSFAYAAITLLIIVVQLGLPDFVARETAIADRNRREDQKLLLWRWTHIVVLVWSFAILTFILMLLWSFSTLSELTTAFVWGLPLLVLVALVRVHRGILQGLGRVVVGQFFDLILRPLVFIAVLAGVALTVSHPALDAESMMLFHLVAAATATGVGGMMILKVVPKGQVPIKIATGEYSIWLLSAATLGSITVVQVFNAQIGLIVLGFLQPPDQTGIFKVAVTGASLVAFGLQAVSITIVPQISKLYEAGQIRRLQYLVTISSRMIMLTALMLATILVVFGNLMLEVLFGADFTGANLPMRILIAGHVGGAVFGPVLVLLNMSGREKDSLRGVGIALFVCVGLNFTLVPAFGINGAAAAAALTMIILNWVLWRSAVKQLGVNSLVLLRTKMLPKS
ncbi:MAG: oligosaccharide flippase family protein [Rhizobiaceae bacterium]